MDKLETAIIIFWAGLIVVSVVGSVFNSVKWSTTIIAIACGVLSIAALNWLGGSSLG